MVKQKYLDKAEILIEALPYIQRFSGKIIVIKYGGSAMLDDELKMKVIKDAVLLKLVGFKPVIVHGGGKEINRWVDKVGMEHEFIDGFRVTDGDTGSSRGRGGAAGRAGTAQCGGLGGRHGH